MKLGLDKAVLAVALVLLAAPAFAQNPVALMDYTGFAYETGGLPQSLAGDELVIAGVANPANMDPIFNVLPSSQEVTVYIYGLLVASAVTQTDGSVDVDYSGGMIEVYEDANLNHVWSAFPPQPDLATFTDGALLFSGSFTRFNLNLNAFGFGIYDGEIDGIGGTAAALCDGAPDCAYTFGGAFGRDIGAQIPDGWDLQIDGTLEIDAAVPTETASFGAVKALFH